MTEDNNEMGQDVIGPSREPEQRTPIHKSPMKLVWGALFGVAVGVVLGELWLSKVLFGGWMAAAVVVWLQGVYTAMSEPLDVEMEEESD